MAYSAVLYNQWIHNVNLSVTSDAILLQRRMPPTKKERITTTKVHTIHNYTTMLIQQHFRPANKQPLPQGDILLACVTMSDGRSIFGIPWLRLRRVFKSCAKENKKRVVFLFMKLTKLN